MVKQTKLWIGGQWVDGEETIALKNPHTGTLIAEVAYAGEAHAKQAIEVAAEAFRSFRKVPAYERSAILRRVADAFAAKRTEIACTLAEEAAKPIKAALAEIDRTVQTYLFAAEAARDIHSETVPMDAAPRGEHHVAYTVKHPLGVVTAITPFNFPANLVAHKVGPAIAAGNTMVLKPAEQTPLTSLLLADLFQEAGLPDGVLNIIPGYGAKLSKMLTTHEDVAFVTFTGSPRVGKLIRQQAELRRVTLELGSNSPLLIDEGFTPDELDRIAAEATAGAFNYSGQVCISIQRTYVHRSCFDSFVERMVTHARALKIGDPLDANTDISALINDAAATRLKQWLDHAVASGAKVETGGTFDGNIMHPTVLTNVPDNVELSCEEAFGPIVLLDTFDEWGEAIAKANHSKFGLNAGAFTKDLQRAMQAAEELEAGGVLLNQIPTFRIDQMPYGGIKESGVGREGVRYAMEDMMDIKMVAIRTNAYGH
ncbi:MAG: aldehyde dehydrogenase family protein [Alicyclobacillaceae bacterium]|nr:aldehyde dehydrogenase family protein [Alicyclobacillaceae bacterium]